MFVCVCGGGGGASVGWGGGDGVAKFILSKMGLQLYRQWEFNYCVLGTANESPSSPFAALNLPPKGTHSLLENRIFQLII